MHKLIFLSVLFLSNVSAFEWIDCKKEPYPDHERIVFYEVITKRVYLECPTIIRMGFFYTYEDYPCITHWAPITRKPSEDMSEWVPCSEIPINMEEPCIFYDKTTDAIFLDIPHEFCVFLGHFQEQIPNISHWQKIPNRPKEGIRESQR